MATSDMGIDFFEIRWHCEQTFDIRFATEDFTPIIRQTNDSRSQSVDIRVGDFIDVVQAVVKKQNPDYQGDVDKAVQSIIAESLGVEVDDVTRDAWLGADLCME